MYDTKYLGDIQEDSIETEEENDSAISNKHLMESKLPAIDKVLSDINSDDSDPGFEIRPREPKENKDSVSEYYHDKESGALFKAGEPPKRVCNVYIKVIGLTRTLEDSE
jgi:hypothetical protein